MWGSSTDSSRLEAARELLRSNTSCLRGQVFTDEQDFQEYITSDPPVVKTNAEHGSIPHPSFATIINEEHAAKVLEHHINSNNRGNDHVNEILIMPVKSNEMLKQGIPSPMFPFPSNASLNFFLLFLGSVVPKSSVDEMQSIRNHHRDLYELSSSLGAKRYSYCTITSEVCGETEWKSHYGQNTWQSLCAAKRKYDPYHLLCPGVKMWG